MRGKERRAGPGAVSYTHLDVYKRQGVLIVFERDIALDDIARTGTIVDARVSSELLKNIFFVKAAMHDGCLLYTSRCV